MQLLGGDQRKAGGEIEAHLMAEHRARAGAGAVVLFRAVGEDMLHQFKILPHGLAFARDSKGMAVQTTPSRGACETRALIYPERRPVFIRLGDMARNVLLPSRCTAGLRLR